MLNYHNTQLNHVVYYEVTNGRRTIFINALNDSTKLMVILFHLSLGEYIINRLF